jgi:sulfocyanin
MLTRFALEQRRRISSAIHLRAYKPFATAMPCEVVDMASRSRIKATGGLVVAALFLLGAEGLDGAPRTANLTIVAGETAAGGGFNYNGYAGGQMTVTVPLNWRVSVTFRNASAVPHSLAVLPYSPAQPTVVPARPAFTGATTPDFATGLSGHAPSAFSFTASKAGMYEFICGVPGHAVAGMWDKLVVSPSAAAPSVTPAAAAKLLRIQ